MVVAVELGDMLIIIWQTPASSVVSVQPNHLGLQQ